MTARAVAVMMSPVSDLGGARPAVRTTAPGWRDPRLWVGVLIVVVSVVAGARLFASADDSVAVWAADTDLVAGSAVSADDLRVVHVRFRDGDDLEGYVLAAEAPDGAAVLTRDVGAGELLPSGALGSGDDADVVHVPVPVEGVRVPPSVRAGSVVDVWASGDALTSAPGGTGDGTGDGSGASGSEAPSPGALLLLEEVQVVEAPSGDAQLGSTSDRQLVIAVPDEQQDAVGPALAAIATGVVTVTVRA